MPSIRSLILEATELKNNMAITPDLTTSTQFIEWYKKTEEFITKDNISYLNEFQNFGYKPIGQGDENIRAEAFVTGVNTAIELLQRIKKMKVFLVGTEIT